MKYAVKKVRSFPSAFTTNGISYFARSIINPGKYDKYVWIYTEKLYKIVGLDWTLMEMTKFDFLTLLNAHYGFCKRKSITIPMR